MLAARDAFLGAGHFEPIAHAVVAAAGPSPACAVELGAGTAYYLARLLDAVPGCVGLALDVSRPAVRRAVRAHRRITAVRCDVWQELPLRDGCADVVLDVFAPRNGPEIARVLAPGGTLVVVTPTPRHLAEIAPLRTISVDERKQERLDATLAPLRRRARQELGYELSIAPNEAMLLLAMGPTAYHTFAVVFPAEPLTVTVSVNVDSYG
jgi:23S rRNA (guanine745-N1)-methyltransferase